MLPWFSKPVEGVGRAHPRHNTPAALSLIPVTVAVLFAAVACGTSRKLSGLRSKEMGASISLPRETESFMPRIDSLAGVLPQRDTLTVTGIDGREVLIMRAVRDDESGDMVATEQISAAVVTARFRNVAERHGKIDLEFQVTVPEEMQDSRWQLRLHPDMFVLQDSIRLDDVVITGLEYRKAQLKGYQQYRRFLDRIITDSTLFVDMRNFEIFLERNLPELYAMRCDSTEVSDDVFESCFGVDGRQVLDHYTRQHLVKRNERLKVNREKMWRKYVKSPIVTEGIRLDTVMRSATGDFVYDYVQTISTRPKLRKVDIVLGGEIYERDVKLYTVPESEPLTFYISSVSAFVDGRERYLTKVISRSVEANATCVIDFRAGKSDIDERMGGNGREISYIKDNLRNLVMNDSFELDSITIVASASPEGSLPANNRLSLQRAKSASDYFSSYLAFLKDSIRREEGFFIEVGDDLSEGRMSAYSGNGAGISFKSRSGGENWMLLDDLVARDSLLSASDVESYLALSEVSDADEREKRMKCLPFYGHLKDDLYPKLRTVRFNFALHRKGMVKDTVHTTVLDTAYMNAVQLVRDHDYVAALETLTAYQDYNTAVAYVALDRNLSAMNILKDCERTAQVNYMLALVHSRMGEEQEAVECYVRSCQQDGSYVHRGNLDPEIAALIKKYNLNAAPADEEWDGIL